MKRNIEKVKLKEILMARTKNELMDLTYFYPVKGKSKLKKEELAEVLVEKLTREEVIRENGIILCEAFNNTNLKGKNRDFSELYKARLLSLLGYGNIIKEKDGIKITFAEEAFEFFEKSHEALKDDIERYILIKSYLLACVRLYGVIEKDFFIDIFNKQNPKEEQLSLEELKIHLNRCEKIQREAVNYYGYIVSDSLLMFRGDLEKLLEERKNKDFYVPEKNELLKYEEEFYTEHNSAYAEFINYINTKVKDKEVAQGLIEDLSFPLRWEDYNPQHALIEFKRRNIEISSLKEVQDFMQVYINLHNNMRKWSNKGFTPSELSKSYKKEVVEKRVIGRNDPCPCGSGKKYKKCCLNK